MLDADGLNALGGRYADVLSARSAPTVLTPHAGELARLLETESAAVERAPPRPAPATPRPAARAIVVLKGDDTLVADPDGLVAVSPGGAPALATAGTGDVLSGVIARPAGEGRRAVPRGRGRRLRPRAAPGASRLRRTAPRAWSPPT